MRFLRTSALCFALLALAVSSAQADTIATFDFDFTGNGGNLVTPMSQTFTAGSNPPISMSLSASATATSIPFTLFTPGIQVNSANPFQSGSGLGVSWAGTITSIFGPLGPISDTVTNNVDSFGPSETLSLQFGTFSPLIEDAVITSITFENIENFGGLGGLLVDDELRILLNNIQLGGIVDPNSPNTFTFNTPIAINSGDTLSFQGLDGTDDFTVSGLTVQANVVPEPASLALWTLLGGVGLAALRKRKTKQVA